jgi:predicted ATPase/DNA-binding CsgD family transcriptional regulator
MTRNRLPLISSNSILRLDGVGDRPVSIVVGTDAWYKWLIDQHIQSFSFRHPLGTFTARRERKRQSWYWYAYRKRAGRLCKTYLGKTEDLTLERLNEAVTILNSQGKDDDGVQVNLDEYNRNASQISSDSNDGKGQLFQPSAFSFIHPTELEQATKHNLPTQLTLLIGREQEVEAACIFLRQPDVHLLTLTGIGGVGKTCLGLKIATDLVKDFSDGVCFVSLASISEPDLVIPTIAQKLGLREPGGQSFFELLAAYLFEKHLLLFLDNFEQVIDAAPALTELLEGCPSLKILVTSREVLRVRGEQEFPVLPLGLPNLLHQLEPEYVSQYAAVVLFLQRAQSFNPDFQITTANAKTIASICVHLDGLPLALELAAARLKLLSPQALLTRLEHRLLLLTQGSRDAHIRHQTLRNTLQWSYDLLDAQEQCLFRRLAVFVGGCTLRAIEATYNPPSDEMMSVLDGVASLLDKNLLQQVSTRSDEEPRLMMLETIREYGLECLTVSGELELIRRSHANYYLTLAEEIELKSGDPQQAKWLKQLEREIDNLRAAMRWSLEQVDTIHNTGDRREMALRFGVALQSFWIVHSHWSEGRTFLELALAASEGIVISVRAKVLEAAASLAVYQIDHDRGETLCRECLAQCRDRGDMKGTAFSLGLLGTIAWQKGDFAVACALMEESLALYKEVGDKKDIASLLTCLGQLATPQGEYAKALAYLEESLAMERELGDARGIAISLFSLALTLFVSRGDPATVHSMLEESLALSNELGDKASIAHCLSHLGLVTLQQGDVAIARKVSSESLVLHREMGNRWGISWVLSISARIEALKGDHTTALALYEESLEIARKIGSKLNIAMCLEGMANVLAVGRYPVRAVQLWGAAEALRESIGAPIWPIERASYEISVTATRTLLGERAFLTAWAKGRTTSLEQTLDVQGPAKMSMLLPTGQPARLTRREIEVLGLLTMGLTSVQIAGQLRISLATVNTHIGSIYTKLGVTSRSAATRYAVEHRLV